MNISVPDWYSRRGFKNLGCDGSQGPQADGDVRCWWFLFIKPQIQLKRAIQWVAWCYWMGVYFLRSWMGLDPSEVWNHSCLRSFIPRLDDFSKPYRLNTSHFLAHKNGLMIMYTQFQAPLKEIHFVTLDNSSLRTPVSSSIIWDLQTGSRMTNMCPVCCYSASTHPGQMSLTDRCMPSGWIQTWPQTPSQHCSTHSLTEKTVAFSLTSDVTFGSNISFLRKVENCSVHVVCMWTKKSQTIQACWSLEGKNDLSFCTFNRNKEQ